jgi:hypothetical protein
MNFHPRCLGHVAFLPIRIVEENAGTQGSPKVRQQNSGTDVRNVAAV